MSAFRSRLERLPAAEWLAWGLLAITFALLITAVAVERAGGESAGDVLAGGLIFPALCVPLLGALVIRRRGSHIVGWLLLGIGFSLGFEGTMEQWAQTALIDEPGSLPLGDLASWFQAWAWMPAWFLGTTLLPAVFPDGARGRSRVLAWVDGFAVAAVTSAVAAETWHLRGPLLLTAPEDDPRAAALNQIFEVGAVVIGLLTLLSLGSLVVRFRRSSPEARRQIGWAVYGVAIAVSIAVAGSILNLPDIFHALQASAIVGGIAIAILRYRLYDIDAVINRTLVYGALTATLAAVYLGSVLVLQLVLSGITSDSNLAIAASTLAVAALFRPARNRIQQTVDRRFFRRRYDAGRTLELFSARLRDQVDLTALDAELRGVVAETMQPAHVSLWLRGQSAEQT